jgi:hypothetical protein
MHIHFVHDVRAVNADNDETLTYWPHVREVHTMSVFPTAQHLAGYQQSNAVSAPDLVLIVSVLLGQ